ncbi:MAG TPA: hypothetical protein VN809_09335 [Telmatospirillum sp.]|nr:hypothetical protein [Telmatospirillum sp.]
MLFALWGAWLGCLGSGGIIVYRRIFHFDAADWGHWDDMRRQYLSGATIPFDFVALGVGLGMLGAVGCLVLTLRSGRLSDFFFVRWPGGILSDAILRDFAVSAIGRFLPGRCRRCPPDRPRIDHGIEALRKVGGFVRWLRALVIHPGRRAKRKLANRPPPRAWDGTIAPGPQARAALEPQVANCVGTTTCVVMEQAVSESTPSFSGSPTVPVADEEPLADVKDDGPVAPALVTDEDSAVFGRAMALFEVWSDPAPDWMQEALREELDRLSIVGWSLFATFGDPAMGLLETALTVGLLPEDPAKRVVTQAILDGAQRRKMPLDTPADDGLVDSPCAIADDDLRPAPVVVAHLTMNAAWLCEIVDNFVMLEDIRAAGRVDDAPSFDERWGAIHQETAERLKFAMQTMSDEDWRSIDQFPDRARRIRILTDRFREALRVDGGGRRDDDGLFRSPPSPVVVSESRNGTGAPLSTSLEDILRGAGYVVRSLPAMHGSASGGAIDYLAQRDGVVLLLRLADLSGGDWVMNGDSLAPWRAATGHAVPSPCRAVWQRLALLRSLSREVKPCAGVVVLKDGQFTDEQAVARIVERDRCRTDVGLAWLDKSSATLPDLAAWLVRVEASQSMASGIG